MLDLGMIEFWACDLCAERLEQDENAELCEVCVHRKEELEILKREILDLRAHELAVAEATGVVFECDGHNPAPGPRNSVLEAIKAHRKAWEQAESIKRLLETIGKKPEMVKTNDQWQEETLRKIKDLETKILKSLTPREQEVLVERFGVKK